MSVLVFLIVAGLFLFYIIEIDHLIDESGQGATGNALIYTHYLIFIGLGMVTVSLGFLKEKEVHPLFLLAFLFIGLALFYLGSLFLAIHNQPDRRLTKRLLGSMGLVAFVSFLLASFLASNSLFLALLVCLMTWSLTLLFLNFNRQTAKKRQEKVD
ncbi:hypothetical protein C4K46_08370 [Streptococcus oricebi]|uniref:Low temperature requirement A protein n=1 Tax=Streptococcus oricebi TaxID=1547447 RepID=A0ABS5B552_9STRE|nr:hypothetical protein [Streptococcus oricebi]